MKTFKHYQFPAIGYLSMTTSDGKSLKTKTAYLLVRDVPNEPGHHRGIMTGYNYDDQKGVKDIITLSFPSTQGDGHYNKRYRADFSNDDFQWDFIIDGVLETAKIGKLDITLNDRKHKVNGTFSFEYSNGRTAKGKFELDNTTNPRIETGGTQ